MNDAYDLLTPEQLLEFSDQALRDTEMAVLNRAAEAWKRAKKEMELARDMDAQAETLRWLIIHRERLIDLSRTVADGKQALLRFEEFRLRRTA